MKEVGLERVLRMDRSWRGRGERVSIPVEDEVPTGGSFGNVWSPAPLPPHSQHSGHSSPITWALVQPGVNASLSLYTCNWLFWKESPSLLCPLSLMPHLPVNTCQFDLTSAV